MKCHYSHIRFHGIFTKLQNLRAQHDSTLYDQSTLICQQGYFLDSYETITSQINGGYEKSIILYLKFETHFPMVQEFILLEYTSHYFPVHQFDLLGFLIKLP